MHNKKAQIITLTPVFPDQILCDKTSEIFQISNPTKFRFSTLTNNHHNDNNDLHFLKINGKTFQFYGILPEKACIPNKWHFSLPGNITINFTINDLSLYLSPDNLTLLMLIKPITNFPLINHLPLPCPNINTKSHKILTEKINYLKNNAFEHSDRLISYYEYLLENLPSQNEKSCLLHLTHHTNLQSDTKNFNYVLRETSDYGTELLPINWILIQL